MEFIQLESLISNMDAYWAHTKEDKEGNIIGRETLNEHTELCQENFVRLFKEKRLEEVFGRFCDFYFPKMSGAGKKLYWKMLINVVTFHDIGKINPNFQRDKMKEASYQLDSKYNAAGSKHSCISAVLYMDYFYREISQLEEKTEQKQLQSFLVLHSYLIARHHSRLISFWDYIGNLKDGTESYMIELFEEYGGAYLPNFILNEEIVKRICLITVKKLDKHTRKESLWLYLYEKLLYSVLVASDYYATARFETGVTMNLFGNLDDIELFMKRYNETKISQSIRCYENVSYPAETDELEDVTDINVLRTELFLDAERVLKAHIDKRIYYLEAPTGGGKSNISMNLSFQLMKYDKSLRKIYYVYPFNTLVEQNRKSLEKVFGDYQEVLQKIAVVNSITPIKRTEDNHQEEVESSLFYEKALLDRRFLNYPVILTTHVSLFDTIFGDTKESVFAFHQLAGSVIVFDEIQSYKNKIWGEMISFLKEMAELLNMKIIIMSATLPNLHLLADNAEGTVQLIKNREKYYQHPCFKNRVAANYSLLEQEYSDELLLDHIKNNLSGTKKILVEFIKKDSAFAFYQKAVESFGQEASVLYMSGDDSLLERSKLIAFIQNGEDRPILLIATQVIEAGVDIDMDIGYKNISMFDSEEQFIGRINRSFHGMGTVSFFLADEPVKIYGEEPRLNQEFMIVNQEMQRLFLNKDFPAYYNRILQIIKMNYNDSASERGLEGFLHEEVGKLSFGDVKERMRLIEDNQWSMSVYLARTLVDEDEGVTDGKQLWKEYRELLEDGKMGYAKKRVKLSDVTSKMNGFIYQIKKNSDLIYDDLIGDIFFIEDGEKYFDNGKLNRKKIQGEIGEFVDFI